MLELLQKDARILLSVREQLESAFRRGLALSAKFDVSTAESGTLRQWDSVAHLQLVVAIEDAFHIRLTPADVMDLKSYPYAVDILQRHGIRIEG